MCCFGSEENPRRAMRSDGRHSTQSELYELCPAINANQKGGLGITTKLWFAVYTMAARNGEE